MAAKPKQRFISPRRAGRSGGAKALIPMAPPPTHSNDDDGCGKLYGPSDLKNVAVTSGTYYW